MLVDILLKLFNSLKAQHNRKILAIGISSIGPVDIIGQKIVNPPNFYGINNLHLAQIIEEKTNLSTYIINDSNAGALAEKVYGKAKALTNFIYLHIMNGIGAGYILQDKIYNGDIGQSGEIGHTSINFSGPVCDCGNSGCLELYANLQNMNQKIQKMKSIYPKSSFLSNSKSEYSWKEIIDAANKLDYYAISALEEFCEYLSYALSNTINLLDINHILIGYDSNPTENMIENMLSVKLKSRVLVAKYRNVQVEKSVFSGDAPLIGSIAMVTDKIFSGEMEF
jgi:predicted NBD/HSP70 family sugar kinase